MEIPDSYREALDCLKKVHVTTEACIHFSDLKNPTEAIGRFLATQVLRWFAHAEGILICYSDLQILKTKGRLVDESPYVFFPISFQALVFQPKEGSYLVGKVNEITKSFVSFLILGIFQGVILLDDLMQAKFMYNGAERCFHNNQKNMTIQLGTIIKFKAQKYYSLVALTNHHRVRRVGTDIRLQIHGTLQGVKDVVVLQSEKDIERVEDASYHIQKLQRSVLVENIIKPEYKSQGIKKQKYAIKKEAKQTKKEGESNEVGENPENIELQLDDQPAETNEVIENPESIELELE